MANKQKSFRRHLHIKPRRQRQRRPEKEEVMRLWQRFREGQRKRQTDHEARDRLIEHYMPLVHEAAEWMARKLPSFVDPEDLIAAGSLGLLDALERFDPASKASFTTFCTYRIRGAILDDLRQQATAPRQTLRRKRMYEQGREHMEATLGRRATDEELAAYLGLTPSQYSALLREMALISTVSLEEPVAEANGKCALELYEDSHAANPLQEMIRQEVKEAAMRGLSQEARLVLTLHYFDGLTLREIGVILGLSESRVCQIRKESLNFLRSKFLALQDRSPFADVSARSAARAS